MTMTSVPGWYEHALAEEPERATVRAAGVETALRMWGPRDGHPVVLVHGGAAHAAWWDHIGPVLTDCRVVALDLSGHGDSGWRDAYRIDLWCDEVLAVLHSEHVRQRPLLVGHSMGGLVTYAVVRDHAAELDSAILVDSEFPRRAVGDGWRSLRESPHKIHSDREAILARFRLLPRSEPRSPFVIGHVAEESIIAVDGGWSWKFDPRVFMHDSVIFEDAVPLSGCPVILVRGDGGLLDDAEAEALATQLGDVEVVTVEDCGHHVLLDHPLALTEIIRRMLPGSETSAPTHSSSNTIIGGS
ncbi:alpha/beta fold hydrolase [Microbacterium alcoholitolerans]|uniref:alpha/beta fold hydrolase n=1 Tax=unclassified Microbacterium TaxID=2609290 RepID=UPI003D180660